MAIEFADLDFAPDGTPYSPRFKDAYFGFGDGVLEREYVFIEGNNLLSRWHECTESSFVIAESGFGIGLNFFISAQLFQKFRRKLPNHPLKRLFFISFEQYPLKPCDLEHILKQYPQISELTQSFLNDYKPLARINHRFVFEHLSLDLYIGDIMDSLPSLGDNFNEKVDAWFLDGFAPAKNPSIWQEDLFPHIARLSKKGGSFATFSAASKVAANLMKAGFEVKKRKGFAFKREMLIGTKTSKQSLPLTDPEYYQNHHQRIDDVAIVGGGVASFFAALSLLERGKQVSLYTESLSHNASTNRLGVFYPQLSDDDPLNISFNITAFDFAIKSYHRLQNLFPFIFEQSGVALIPYNEKNRRKIEKILTHHYPHSLCTPLADDEIRHQIGIDLPFATPLLFFPDGGFLSPQDFLAKGFSYLRQQGLRIYTEHRLEQIIPDSDRVKLQFAQAHSEHQAVIIATGHRLADLSPLTALNCYPVRGQVSEAQATKLSRTLTAVLCADSYLTPAYQDFHILGASHKRDNVTLDYSEQEQEENFAKIRHNLGIALVDERKYRVAIRCAMRDRMPLVGMVGDFARQKEQFAKLFELKRRQRAIPQAVFFERIFALGALGSRGFTTAPLCGELIASLICNEIPPLPSSIIEQLATNRYWIRKLSKGTAV